MRRSIPIVVTVVALLLIAGCSATGPTMDYESGPKADDLSAGGPADGRAWEVTITQVIDGDTVEARFPNGEVDTLRLLGVDTPETDYDRVSPEEFDGIPATVAGREHLLVWGDRASAFATDELEGETVRIAVDSRADRRGGYGRLLVYVYHDGENVNERLLTDGYARLYDSPFSLRAEFEAAEDAARSDERGVWSFDGPGTTRDLATMARDSAPRSHRSIASETPRIAPHSGHSYTTPLVTSVSDTETDASS